MRTSEYYGVQVPELGDRADITVVSNAIAGGEKNQSGKIENMKATLSGSIISLVSECRTDKLVKYYNGLAVQFISPVNAQAGTAYKIKVDNLAEQPYNNKVDIKIGDIVQAIYGSTGFVSANTPIPRSSAINSDSEVTMATSKAVKQAYDLANSKANKTIQVIAGNGLTGGGDLTANRTINVASADEGIVINADNIKLNIVNDYNTANSLRPVSAKVANDLYELIQGFNKCPYNIGDILLTTNSTNPSTVWLGTTWQKIEGRFLLGTSGSGVSKATGGSNSKTITQANLPNVKLKVDSHNHNETAHDHYMFSSVYQNKTFKHITDSTVKNYSPTYRAAMRNTTDRDDYVMVGADGLVANSGKTSKGVGNTGTSAPNTSALGSGQALDITPSYYTVHMWLRLS